MLTSNKSFYPKERERQQAEEQARMDKIVENSSEKNRNFFIVYLGLLIYAQAIIFSTSGLKLPLIDLTVPLAGFMLLGLFLLSPCILTYYKITIYQF